VQRRIKIAILHLLKLGGVFALVRYLTRDRLRILAYHGVASGDEYGFQPYLFMRPEVFRRRMRILAGQGWRIVDLQTAVDELAGGKTAANTVTVTIDDGWKSTLTVAAPLLRELRIPATLYVTTYYCERPAEVFNVALFYMLWKSRGKGRIELRSGIADLDGSYDFSGDNNDIGLRWLDYCNQNLDWRARQAFLGAVARAVGLDLADVVQGDRFRNMTPDEVRRIGEFGIDIELHTHRHRLPPDPAEVEREITENRALLEAWIGKSCRHFCYPSGKYVAEHPSWLAAQGVVSATTSDSGMCRPGDNLLLLPRIMDRDDWTDIEFEAALCGVPEYFKTALRRTQHDVRRSIRYGAALLAAPFLEQYVNPVWAFAS
jgi:peptidoglycan/xylan/chitin deacetylase (PgdA/CDA1 family)